MFSLKTRTPCKPETLRESHFIRKIRLPKELVWYAPVCAVAGSRETKVKCRLGATVAFYSVFLALPQHPSAHQLSFTLRRASHSVHYKIARRHHGRERRAQFYARMSTILSARMFRGHVVACWWAEKLLHSRALKRCNLSDALLVSLQIPLLSSRRGGSWECELEFTFNHFLIHLLSLWGLAEGDVLAT